MVPQMVMPAWLLEISNFSPIKWLILGVEGALWRGFSAAEFHLRMTREEIGSYLGLKLETVSRAFSRFQEEGLMAVQQKHIRILDSAGLKKLIQHQPAVR